MINDDITKDIQTAEGLVDRIKQRSQNCDPNIVYSLNELQTITDKLFKKFGDISKDRSLHYRFNQFIMNTETYRGNLTYNCDLGPNLNEEIINRM